MEENTYQKTNEDYCDEELERSTEAEDLPKKWEASFLSDSEKSSPVCIDWAELEGALENNSPELHSFLNRYTGDVIRIFQSHTGVERKLQEVEADPAYVYIEPISSREQYTWMEEFIEILEESPLRDKLCSAVDGKGAFRRFKDVLMEDQEQREKWFSKRSLKLKSHIEEWLALKNIVPDNQYPSEEDSSARKLELVKKIRYSTGINKNFGTSYRRKAHELIDLVPSKELPFAVAFLQFLSSSYRPSSFEE